MFARMNAIDYREYAKECRAVAALLRPADGRERLFKVAEAWERLAAERERQPIEFVHKT